MQTRLVWIVMGTLFAAGVASWVLFKPEKEDRFTRVMTLGQGHLQRGDGTNAIQAYAEAVALAPESLDAWLNLANAYLLAGNPEEVIKNAREALSLDPLSPAAHYLMGCAYLRLNQPEPALQAFQESQRIDPAVTALDFQLGLAHERLGQYDDAVLRFETVVQFEPDHLCSLPTLPLVSTGWPRSGSGRVVGQAPGDPRPESRRAEWSSGIRAMQVHRTSGRVCAGTAECAGHRGAVCGRVQRSVWHERCPIWGTDSGAGLQSRRPQQPVCAGGDALPGFEQRGGHLRAARRGLSGRD